jgi:hypothetical protein
MVHTRKGRTVILIENISQQAHRFNSISELKDFAKKHDLKIKRSPMSDTQEIETYYTEGF